MFKELRNEQVKQMLDFVSISSKKNFDLFESMSLQKIDSFFCFCEQHELDSVVISGMPLHYRTNVPARFLEKYEQERQRLGIFKSVAEWVCETMSSYGIGMVVLKNGGILVDMTSDPASCPMGDIDTLVQKDDFLKAHSILLDLGFCFSFRSIFEKEDIEIAFLSGSTEYYYVEPNTGIKVWLELSWRTISGRWIRPDFEPSSRTFINNAYYSRNTKVLILNPEDNLLQVAVHTAKHSYFRSPGIRLHLDVDRIVNNQKIDWDSFLNNVTACRVRTSVYFSLLFSKILLKTQIPDSVLLRLKPNPIKRLIVMSILRSVGILYPERKNFGKLRFLVFQAMLYDSVKDLLVVVFPGNSRLKKTYKYKTDFLMPFYSIIHILDLAGLRKKK